jgi:hypothetical protein
MHSSMNNCTNGRTDRTAGLVATLIGCIIALGVTPPAHAIIATYTNSNDFYTDLASLGLTPTTLDFDAESPGDTIADGATYGGITFSNFTYNSLGGLTNEPIIFTDVFDTTSGDISLGFDDGFDSVFVNDDEFEMTFGGLNALGLFIITTEDMLSGDISLEFGATNVAVDTLDLVTTLGDGGLVYFLGVINSESLVTSAAIRSFIDPDNIFFEYNIDDITHAVAVPELSSCLFVGAVGVLAAFICRSRKSGLDFNTDEHHIVIAT